MINEIDIFTDYLRFEKNSSEYTVISYNRDLVQFYRFLSGDFGDCCDYEIDVKTAGGDIDINTVGKEEIRSFVGYLFDRQLKKSSIERKIAVLKSFFKYLHNMDYIAANPAQRIFYPKKRFKTSKISQL